MKQGKLIQKAKKFMAGVIALAMTVTMFPAAPVTAAEEQESTRTRYLQLRRQTEQLRLPGTHVLTVVSQRMARQ